MLLEGRLIAAERNWLALLPISYWVPGWLAARMLSKDDAIIGLRKDSKTITADWPGEVSLKMSSKMSEEQYSQSSSSAKPALLYWHSLQKMLWESRWLSQVPRRWFHPNYARSLAHFIAIIIALSDVSIGHTQHHLISASYQPWPEIHALQS
jgi:hypothetical protein